MSDPVLAIVLFAAFFIALPLAHFFKTLDGGLWRDGRTPVIAGIVAGAIVRLVTEDELLRVVLIGVLLTAAALYVRLTGRESEPTDGLTLGALMGGAAAIPLVFTSGDDAHLLRFAECVLAGAVAGYGVTFALSRVTDRLKQLALDAATAGVSVAVAYVPTLAIRAGIPERRLVIGVAAAIPLLLVAIVFKQWPGLRAELREEAALNVLDEMDVRTTAHPLLRLGRAGWHDAEAHREFVRVANRIALRKRQQRHRPDAIARLYQVEIIKLRMQLQEMSAIDFRMRAAAARERAQT
ncbi:MAG TPA: hypothetical protein VGF69_10710 [Thermoanaerobaculia bacterium]|jgi:hypothetical protein